MPPPKQQDRLQPSLLDRLTDEEPEDKTETAQKRIIPMRKLREIVLRDLTWLLNSGNLQGTDDLDEYPEIQHSVLNYGMPDFSGRTISDLNEIEIENIITRAIRDFEPRILPKTLKVTVISTEKLQSQNAILLEIKGELWAHPLPLHLYLKSEIDLEGGTVKVIES